MSPGEHEEFSKTGKIPRGYVLESGKPDGWEREASPGDRFVEFDVDPSILSRRDPNNGWM